MANDYSFFDYIVDVFKGDMPGLVGMYNAPKDNGPLGEYLVKHVLDNSLATTGYPLYTNLIVPNAESGVGTAEIDAVMLAREGVYVFESKNYSGWIFGSAEDRNWTAKYSSTKKSTFYNPILQNRTHVKALAAYLCLPGSAFHSYIVFSQRCELKKVPPATDEYVVCKRPDLRKQLSSDMKRHMRCFTWEEVKTLNGKLHTLTETVGENAREEHIEQVKAAQQICPWCGMPLVERHRKKDGAAFIACTGYPACTYTRSEW